MKQIEKYNVKLLTVKENIHINGGQYCWGCAVGDFLKKLFTSSCEGTANALYGAQPFH